MSTKYQLAKSLSIHTRMRKQRVSTIYYKGQMVPFLLRGNKIVYAAQPVKLPETAHRMITDADGTWFEIGFLSAHALEGNATDGWTDPEHYLSLMPQNSFDLTTWSEGTFINAPGGAVVDNGDGTYWYWQRSTWPKFQKNAIVDFDQCSTRGNKSLTALNLFNANITLPNFPYAVETAMPQLQTDLRAAGYADAVCSYTPAPYTAEIIRHYLADDGMGNIGAVSIGLTVIHDGESVVEVRSSEDDLLVPLPGYPYALPSQAAQLQADLVAAGQSGSVVRLFAGEWRIYIPNRTTAVATAQRNLKTTFTPNDPFPRWQQNNVYDGLIADNTVTTPYSNMRTATGVPVTDAAAKQFCRLAVRAGSRPGANTLVGALLHWLKKENL